MQWPVTIDGMGTDMKNLWLKMKEQPDKWIFWGMLSVVLASMVPVWVLSFYAAPNCDDYIYGAATHAAWQSTGSVWEVLRAAAKTTAQYWHNWQGTYSSIFLMTLSPGIGQEKLYFLTTFLMTGMLAGSMFALLYVVLKKYVGAWGYQAGACVLVLLFLAVETMVAPTDGLYWYNGAVHYVFMESALFFQTAVFMGFRKAEKKGARMLLLALSCLLAFVLGGANLLTGLQACILAVLFCGYSLLFAAVGSKKQASDRVCRVLFGKVLEGGAGEKRQLWLALPLLVTLAGFGMNVLAPGNNIRETTAEGMGAVRAVVLSFYWAAVFVTEWMTPLVLAGFAVLCPVIWRMVSHVEDSHGKASFLRPVVALAVSVCLFAAMFTPTLYATSSEGPDRCKNVMRIVLYLLVFFNLVNWLGWCLANRPKSLPVCIAKEVGKKSMTWSAIGFLWMGAVFLLAADKNTYTSVSALRCLANGEAVRYDEENRERFALYNDEAVLDVVITPLTARPYLLFKEDVGNEGSPDYWINIAIVGYYGKSSLTVQKVAD